MIFKKEAKNVGTTKFLVEGTLWPAGKASHFPVDKAEFYISHQRKTARCKLSYVEIIPGLVHVSLENNGDLLINMTINPEQDDTRSRYSKLGYNRLYLLILFEGILNSVCKNSEIAMRCLEEFRFSINMEVDNGAAAFLSAMLFL